MPLAEQGKHPVVQNPSRKRAEGSNWQDALSALKRLDIEHPLSFLHIYY